MLERDRLMACLPLWPRSLAVCAAAARTRLRQAGQLVLGLQHEQVSLLVRQHVLAELGAERGQPLGDRRHPLPGLGVERGAGLDEAAVVALQHARLLLGEAEVALLLHQRIDAPEQLGVLVDAHGVLGEARRHLALDRLDRLVGVGAREIVENGRHAIEAAPGALQRLDRVLERRPGRVLGDHLDFRDVVGKRLVEGRHEMLVAHAVERRHLERRLPLPQQGIAGLPCRLPSAPAGFSLLLRRCGF